ncbi:Protein F55C12.5 a [Aphelenchoides avenae]|nr:Protein F55C12.5 a [Aphelenchus avenae]
MDIPRTSDVFIRTTIDSADTNSLDPSIASSNDFATGERVPVDLGVDVAAYGTPVPGSETPLNWSTTSIGRRENVSLRGAHSPADSGMMDDSPPASTAESISETDTTESSSAMDTEPPIDLTTHEERHVFTEPTDEFRGQQPSEDQKFALSAEIEEPPIAAGQDVETSEEPDAARAQPDALSWNAVSSFFWDGLTRLERLPFYPYLLTSSAALGGLCLMLPSLVSGMLIGLYVSHVIFLCTVVSSPDGANQVEDITSAEKEKLTTPKDVVVKESLEESVSMVYEGWMNILNEPYHPFTFHVNDIQTVLVRLEGSLLKISRPERPLLKHAFYEDPTLTDDEPKMLSVSVYDLSHATVALRPKRLAKRRWWVRKYPICIKLPSPEYEQHDRDDSLFLSTQEDVKEELKERQRNFVQKLFRRKKHRKGGSAQSGDSLRRSASAELLGRKARWSEEQSEAEDTDAHCHTYGGTCRSRSSENVASSAPLAALKRNYPGQTTRASRNIYLFARSTREKEHWFHKLRRASNKYSAAYARLSAGMEDANDNFAHGANRRALHAGSSAQKERTFEHANVPQFATEKGVHGFVEYARQTAKRLPVRETERGGVILMDIGRQEWERPSFKPDDNIVFITNMIVSRILYDFARDKTFQKFVHDKIQNKMASLHLPYFVESLELTAFDLGTDLPTIPRIYPMYVNDWGIWLDFDLKYVGSIKLRIETSVNLFKLKYNDCLEQHPAATAGKPGRTRRALPPSLRYIPSNYADEEKMQSAETSPDEDYGNKMRMSEPVTTKKKPAKKLLSFIDKVAHSTIFKQLTDLKLVQDAMEGLADTQIVMHVEITEIEGVMTLNLPPPPSERLWWGFRESPVMKITSTPEIAGKPVHLSALSEWIESKLRLMLDKNVIMPNMDDFVLKIMDANELVQPELMVQ